VFALSVIEIRGLAIIGCKHCQLSVLAGVPRVKAKAVSTLVVVIYLLKNMHILEGTAFITFNGVVLPNDIHILVIDILLFVSVFIFVVIGRGCIYGSCGYLPPFISVCESQKFIECFKRAYTLNVLQSESVGVSRLS
jgi:hypothetical protein